MRDYDSLVCDLHICGGCNEGEVCQNCSRFSRIDDYENGDAVDPCNDELLLDAADAIEELQAKNDRQTTMIRKQSERTKKLLAAAPHWVSVEERLPDEWREVLTYSPIHSDEKNPHMIQLCWYIGFGKWRECQYGEIMEIPITHWMPLPEPPKGVE